MSWPVLPYGFLGTQGSSEEDTYQVSRSLRFNGTSKYLSRTFSASNRKTWTWSGWVKRSSISSANNQTIFGASAASPTDNTNLFNIQFTSADTLSLSGGASEVLATSQVFRDPAAWYHIVVAFDTTQATLSNRIKMYVNGSQVTSLSVSTYVIQDFQTAINSAVQHDIGGLLPFAGRYFDGYIAEVNFIDGLQLTPSSFGETESATSRWRPIAYTGAYGANGFYLPFSDNSAATATTLGKDFAPISGAHTAANNWTPNSFSVTAYATNDSLVDSPTIYGLDTGVGGEVRGNYATLNWLSPFKGTILNGNLSTNAGLLSSFSTIGMSSGKWYCEMYVTAVGTESSLGVTRGLASTQYMGTSADSWGYYFNGQKYNNSTPVAYGAAYTTGDTIGAAFDANNGTIIFYKNGVSQGTAYTGLTSAPYFFGCSGRSNDVTMNFGQQTYKYAAPSGYKALCSTNFPTPAIQKSSTAMDVVTYTGTGATLTNSSLNFSPDLVWLKSRSAATDHALYDSVRGATFDLSSTSTAAETTQAQGLTSFNASGLTIGTLAKLNTTSATYVGWAWDESVTGGLDIVGYVGNGTSGRTISHNLGVTPKFILVKNRTTASDWPVYHASLPASNMLFLHLTNATAAISAMAWGGVSAASSTTFTVIAGSTDIRNVNTTSNNYVAYCFAEVDGFSKFGSYTGNAATDGSFVYCGFRPRWVMVKNTTSAYNWIIYDTARSPENLVTLKLVPNSSQEENGSGIGGVAFNTMDILANGFKLRSTNLDANQSGATYIFAAFAEAPFKYSRAR